VSSTVEAAPPPHSGGGELAARLEAVRESLEAVEASTDRLTRLTTQLFDVGARRKDTLELEFGAL